MGGFWANIGLFAVFAAIVFGYAKILETKGQGRSCEDEDVCRAAEAFARGESLDSVRTMLEGCEGLSPTMTDAVLEAALPHRSDRDGGYRAFLRAADRALGEGETGGRRTTL